MKEHLQEAIEHFRARTARYTRAERYYAGDHDLAFATDKFKNAFGSLFREFALNLCPAICDAVRDKLRITGFSPDQPDGKAGAELAAAAGRVWTNNRMRLRAGEVHKEALKCGDAYMIVWPDAAGRAALYPNRASTCSVTYDEEFPGRVIRAAKYWRSPDRCIRMNILYPDRIEKFATRRPADILSDPAALSPAGEPVPNPFGAVPVFHFANNADIGAFGRSEFESAVPIQDGLNKSVLDMLVAMEYAAYRQRWASGIEVEYDLDGRPAMPFTAGADHVWMTSSPDSKFGDFNASALDQFIKVKDGFRVDIASVTGTPLHYFTPGSDALRTGAGVKRNESRFLAKVRDRQEAFGQVWSDVIAFGLLVEGVADEARLLTRWEDPAPISEREVLENIILKKQIGLPDQYALSEAGYGEADIKTMLAAGGKRPEHSTQAK